LVRASWSPDMPRLSPSLRRGRPRAGLDNMLPARWSLFEMFFVVVTVAVGLTLWRDASAAVRRESPSLRRARSVTERLLSRWRSSCWRRWCHSCRVAIPTVSTTESFPRSSLAHCRHHSRRFNDLTYPYVVNDYRVDDGEDAMLWQLSTNFRWRLMGGYFLRPEPAGPLRQSRVDAPDTWRRSSSIGRVRCTRHLPLRAGHVRLAA